MLSPSNATCRRKVVMALKKMCFFQQFPRNRKVIIRSRVFQSTCISTCLVVPLLCPRSGRALWRSERARPDLLSDWLAPLPMTAAAVAGSGSVWFWSTTVLVAHLRQRERDIHWATLSGDNVQTHLWTVYPKVRGISSNNKIERCVAVCTDEVFKGIKS